MLRLRGPLISVLTVLILFSLASSAGSTDSATFANHPLAPSGSSLGATTSGAIWDHSPTQEADYPGVRLPTSLRLSSNLPAATVLDTLLLANHTLLPGNVVPQNGTSPLDVTLDINDSKLFVGTQGGLIVVVNTSTAQLIDTIPVAPGVWGIAYDLRNNEVYAAEGYGANKVTVVAASNDTILGSIEVGSAPVGVTVDSANGRVYAMNTASNNVSVIDDSTNKVVGTIGVGTGPFFGALDTANGEIFVTNNGANNVSIIDTATNMVIGSASVGVSPAGVVYDPANGNMYVADHYPNPSNIPGFVTVLSGSTGAYVTTVTVGVCPEGVTYDSATREVYVTDTICSSFGNVTVINGTTNTVAATIPFGWYTYPDAIVYDQSNGLLYASNAFAGNVSIIDGSTRQVIGTVGAGEHPSDLVYDPTNGVVYVADTGGNDVAILNGSTGAEVGTLRSTYGPAGLAYDDANRDLYVSNYFSDNVSVINTSTGRVVASIPVGAFPQGVEYDPANGDLYVANCNSNNVSVIRGSSNSVVATVVAGVCPDEITLDSSTGDLYVSDLGPSNEIDGIPGNVTVIDGGSNRAIASIPTGTGPLGAAYDPENGDIYVACFITGNLTVIDGATERTVDSIHIGLYPTELAFDPQDGELFVATGRPGNVAYSDQVAAVNISTDTLLGEVSVGTDSWAVAFDAATMLLFTTNTGSGTVSLLRPTVYPPPQYTVTFQETGLPGDTSWSVTLNGTKNSSSSSSLGFSEANGNYSYSVTVPIGYLLLTPSNGYVTVNGHNASALVRFARIYSVTFAETGLLLGSTWAIIWNGTTHIVLGASLTLPAPNGSFPFSLSAANGYSPTPSNGTVLVNGTDVKETIQFVAPGPSIASVVVSPERGPVGTTFTLSPVASGGVGVLSFLYFGLPLGCATANVSVLSCTPRVPGNTTVEVIVTDSLSRSAIANASLQVTQLSVSHPRGTTESPRFLGLPWGQGVALFAGALALAGVAVGLLFWRQRDHGRTPPSGNLPAREKRRIVTDRRSH
jgi:YVTN family beta-propeller protein